MKIILGIDPGSRVTGYGVIRSNGNKHEYITSGCIRTGEGDLSSRLHAIYKSISTLIEQYRPVEASIEEVFVNANVNSALKLGQARGAALVAFAQYVLPVAEYAPRRIKQAVVGYGGADKSQVQHMVKTILCLNKAPALDAADALAVALCHAHTREITI